MDINIAYRPFPLHPETPVDGMTLEQLFAGRNMDIPAAQARMADLMAEEGLPYGRRTMTYNSRLAQELAKWAEKQPGGDRIHDELFRAYFVDNVNLGIIENLLSVTQQLGLSRVEAQGVLEGRQFRAAVDADWQRARQLEISGVPTFIRGGNRLVGAQTYENLVTLVTESDASERR
jgi:predicted DsbA family dithiol-disulfide isomerase